MLIAIFTILFLGGGSSGVLDYISATRDNIKSVVEQDDRRREALAIVRAMKSRAQAHSKAMRHARKDIGKELTGDEPSEVLIDSYWYRYFAQRESYNADMLDLRFQLHDQLSREEWEAIFAPEEEE